APTISYTGRMNAEMALPETLPSSTPAILEAMANKNSANPSSRATIPSIVVVSGPRDLYSLRTEIVEAGSVAEEIAPRRSARAHTIGAGPKIILPTRPVNSVTSINGVMPSHSNILVSCFPYLTKTSFFSSPPTIKPIKPKAKYVEGFNA
ncbi:MAG: hypothetical protein ABIH57_02120, partial [Candidatus Omnitrophota bacterium]